MAEDREEDRGFTVSDRRRFSPETGEVRGDAGEEGSKVDREQGQAGERHPGRESASSAQAKEEATEEKDREDSTRGGGPPPEITLAMFVMSLSTQVLMLMGEIPDPGGRKLDRDMAGAKQVIDILGMLKEKTKGNLDKNEDSLLENVLYDLRMRYVELLKSGPEK
jgi:hypothetical protein